MPDYRLKLVILSLIICCIGNWAFALEQRSEPLISMEFKDADIKNVLRILAKQADLNIIAGEEIKGKVTVSFVDVTLEEALEQILASQGYVYIKTDNIIRVTTPEKLDIITKTFTLKYANAEEVKNSLKGMLSSKGGMEVDKRTNTLIITDTVQRLKDLVPIIKRLDVKISKEAQLETEKVKIPTITKMFSLKYAKAEEIKITLEELKSKEGKVIANKEANAIIVTDTPINLEKIGKYLEELDVEPRQVLIEAKIVEITLDKDTQLGINWEKFDFQVLELEEKPGQAYTGGVTTDFSLGETGLTLNLFEQNTNVILNALAQKTEVDVLSNPRIVTLDHQEARINKGERVPYKVKTVTTEGVVESIQFVDVGILLKVIPHISPDNSVIMDLHPEVSEAIVGLVEGVPTIKTKEASTQVLIRDGQTVAIGGMIEDKKTKYTYKVPVLGSIPLLGTLFRKTRTVRNKVEIVFFITPHILRKGEIRKPVKSEEPK